LDKCTDADTVVDVSHAEARSTSNRGERFNIPGLLFPKAMAEEARIEAVSP
jgi:hypothetical protein